MKTFYCLFIIISLSLAACKDDTAISLENVNNDSLNFYFEKANQESLDFKSRHNAADSIKKIISSLPNDSLNRKNYFKLANRYFNMNAMDNYRETTELIISHATAAKDSTSLAKAYSYLGDYFGSKFESEKAYQNYFFAEKIYSKLHDDSKVAKTLLNKSVIQFNEKDFIGSERSAINALEILKKTSSDELTYEANNVLGVIYFELSEFDKAIEYHNKALLILKKQNVPFEFQSKATSLNNLGAVYQKRKNYKKALAYYNESLKSKNIFENKVSLYATVIDNIAYSKFKLNDLNSLPGLFYESLKIRDSIKYFPGIVGSKLNLSEFYAFKQNIPLSQKFAKEAYSLAKEKKLSNEELLSLKQLSKVDPKNSSFYSSNYIRINDSLQLSERQIRNKLARIEFETDELIEQKDKLVEQRQSLIYLGFSLLVIGIFVYVIRIQASKNRELLLVQEQQAANEEIYQLMLTQQEKVEEVRQLEKIKIGQELHDSILGKLFGTRMDLGRLNSSTDAEDIEKRTTFIDQLQTLEGEIREISHDLNTEKTAVFNNFVLMVSNFIENQRTAYGTLINVEKDEKIDWNELDNITKINLYRVLQESFQNINKYANASKIELSFKLKNDVLELKIKDNGQGFDVKKKKKGIGLKNMTSRMKTLNGTMHIDSKIGSGTTLLFKVPKNNPK
ncbi:tetratricopeptide repeat-containing sensor histidine kinase [Flavobacterium antarcticum]|uniref:ATP-binding protein n=1 Tax=Flavobacterium antarcticum TaxID=271155 RepID=UPI0004288170|nr:tetratricopeptide repeat-containing sensor histidine kinase [Flavobacterium antarcticum]